MVVSPLNIKYLSIKNFRGIKSLSTVLDQPLICLIGPGDSTKTTVLDAIELALWPVYAKTITDLDFYGCISDENIEIEVGVGDAPTALLSDRKFGHLKRGWTADCRIEDEPDDKDTEILSVHFEVNSDFEPMWTVVADRSEPGKLIFHRDRSTLGVVRLGDWSDRDLSWGRGTALSRMSGSDARPPTSVVADVYRTAREQVSGDQMKDLATVASRVEQAAKQLGVKPKDGFVPLLDTSQLPSRSGAISLHDGQVPLQMAGLGTRRLTALAIQRDSIPEGAIALVDEIEHGIEPFRVRRLIQHFRDSSRSHANLELDVNQESFLGQAILTTHSPTALVELDSAELLIVRSTDGVTELKRVADDLQPTIRASSEAFFASKVVVCEGKTEFGLLRALESSVAESHHGAPFALAATALVEGGGSEAATRASHLASLGYETLLLADSDRDLKPNATSLAASGIKVLQWSDSVATEERVCLDVPLDALQRVVDLAACIKTTDSVRDAIASRISVSALPRSTSLKDWLEVGINEIDIRLAIGHAAKTNSWFKRIDYGEDLGYVLAEFWPRLQGTDLRTVVEQLFGWIYDD